MVQSGTGFGAKRRSDRVHGIEEGYCTSHAVAIGQRLQPPIALADNQLR